MERHKVTYENFAHRPNGYSADNPYAYDFTDITAPPQPYKQDECIKMYPNGRMEILDLGYMKPDIRYKLRQYGVDSVLKSEMRNVTFHMADGRRVFRHHIDGDIFLRDEQRQLVKMVGRQGGGFPPITFYGPHAYPSGGKDIPVTVPDKAAERAYTEEIKDVLAFAKTYATLSDEQPGREWTLYGARQIADMYIRKKSTHMLTPDRDHDKLTLLFMGRHPGEVQKMIVQVTSEHLQVPHLFYREKA